MKKLLLTLLLATAFASFLYAQRSKSGMHRLGYTSILPEVDSLSETNAITPAEIEDAHQAIVKDFSRRCKEPVATRWYKMPKGGYAVKFAREGAWYRIDYNVRDEWVTTICIRSQPQLPESVKNKLGFSYAGYTITRVEEIEYVKNIDIAYVVHLEDNGATRTVCICNGRIETLDDTASN